MLTNVGLLLNSFMTGLAAEPLKILQSSICYRTLQLFSLCTHEKVRTDSGGRGKRMVETLERRGGEYQAHSLCIYLGENGFGQSQPTSMVLH